MFFIKKRWTLYIAQFHVSPTTRAGAASAKIYRHRDWIFFHLRSRNVDDWKSILRGGTRWKAKPKIWPRRELLANSSVGVGSGASHQRQPRWDGRNWWVFLSNCTSLENVPFMEVDSEKFRTVLCNLSTVSLFSGNNLWWKCWPTQLTLWRILVDLFLLPPRIHW